MSPCNIQHETCKGFYLPHHAVIKRDNIVMKVRVVFDEKEELFAVLVRFCSHGYPPTVNI